MTMMMMCRWSPSLVVWPAVVPHSPSSSVLYRKYCG